MIPRRILKFKAPVEDQLYEASWDLYKAHGLLKGCKNLLHASVFDDIITLLKVAPYKSFKSLESLKRKEGELSVLLSVVEQDVTDFSDEEHTKRSMVEATERFAEAVKSLSQLTRIHLLLQLHFELLARYSERYEEPRLLRLSRLRDAFFESSTVEILERYIALAEKLEERGVASSSFWLTLDARFPGKQLKSTREEDLVELRRELLDELWLHSTLEQLPRESKPRDLNAVLAARKPHPGVRFQAANGAVPKRGT